MVKKPIIQLVKNIAEDEKLSNEYVLCQIGKRLCNLGGKRNLAKIFEKLGKENSKVRKVILLFIN